MRASQPDSPEGDPAQSGPRVCWARHWGHSSTDLPPGRWGAHDRRRWGGALAEAERAPGLPVLSRQLGTLRPQGGGPGDLIPVPHSPPTPPAQRPRVSVSLRDVGTGLHTIRSSVWSGLCSVRRLFWGEGLSVRPHWGFLCPTGLGRSQPGEGRGSLCQAGRMRLELHDWGSSLGLACKLCDLGKCLTVWPSVVSSGKWAHS